LFLEIAGIIIMSIIGKGSQYVVSGSWHVIGWFFWNYVWIL